MKTRIQLKKILEDFASNHLQINDFGYGQEFEQQAENGINYPLLWVVPETSTISNVDFNRNYMLIVADRVRKDESNEIDVDSDTELILLDAISYLYKYAQNNDLALLDNFNVTPFWEKWTDEVTGYYTTITIQDYFDYDSCGIPITGQIPEGQFNDGTGVFISPTLYQKSVTIPTPTINDDIPLFYAYSSILVKQINDVLAGTSPELSYNIYFDEDKNSLTPTKLWNTDRTATSQAGSESEQFDNRLIPANNWVWIKPSAVNGTVNIFSVNMFYKLIVQ